MDSGTGGLFGDDDEEGVDSKRRVKRELGAEGFLDELDFEETFADDEDRMEHDDKEDEEAKELEVCSFFCPIIVGISNTLYRNDSRGSTSLQTNCARGTLTSRSLKTMNRS